MLLSVLSALARLDIDPWHEAAKLAVLPGETATHRLASLIAALPDEPSPHPELHDDRRTPDRAVAAPDQSQIASRKEVFGAGAATHPRAAIYLYVIVLVFVLGVQWIAANRQPSASVDSVQAPASNTVFPTDAPAKRWSHGSCRSPRNCNRAASNVMGFTAFPRIDRPPTGGRSAEAVDHRPSRQWRQRHCGEGRRIDRLPRFRRAAALVRASSSFRRSRAHDGPLRADQDATNLMP